MNEKEFKSGIDDRSEDDDVLIRADAFVRPIYRPQNSESEKLIKSLLEQLELPTSEKYVTAMASVIAACMKADTKGSNLIAFPGDSRKYTNAQIGWRIAKAVKYALVAKGYLVPLNRHTKGNAIVYEATGLDLSIDVHSSESTPVRVKESKKSWREKGRSIPRKRCLRRYDPRFREEEKRIENLNKTYTFHPLDSPKGLSWGGVFRGFNEGRMDRGGRLYGDWQRLKPPERLKLTIDGEPLVEIDIVASSLFIVSATSGRPTIAKDPYSSIAWVEDKRTRDLAKRLVSAMISTGGQLNQFPTGVRDEFDIPNKDHLDDYQDAILAAYPHLKHPVVSGMEAMFLESEVILRTIEELAKKGIVAYPVHDCLLVAERFEDEAVSELWRNMEAAVGSKPWLKVSYGSGSETALDPSEGRATGVD